MNWGRGLFRVWLILTVLWIAGIGWFGNQDIVKRYRPIGLSHTIVFYPQSLLSVESGDKSDTCDTPVRSEIVANGLPDGAPMSLIVICEPEYDTSWSKQYLATGQVEAAVNVVKEQVELHDQEERMYHLRRIWTLAGAMALPFAILLVVIVLRWVVRGFRRPA